MEFFVQLDPNFQELVVFLLTAAVSFVILQLVNTPALKWLGDYLGQYKVGIVTWLSGLVFQLLQNALNQIPAQYDNVALLVMQLIVEVAIALGVFAFWRRAQARGFRALM